ncbi:hypothetical protein JI528_15800, partial [Listeria monocytogenes]|uniref:D-alanyl-lipoteichoic acid biosynthesis protein DltD n=1 Tax=Listeria monocytogenes TaxID=1639 RepID=UPI001F0DD6AF|nr:hypothetical protein [Listeria monocytogenes]
MVKRCARYWSPLVNSVKLAHSQKKWDYRFSPEYGDFQAALEQLAEKNVDVLFVIPPVN